VAGLRWSSFSTYDLVEGSPSLPLRRRPLTVAPPSKQPVDVVGQFVEVDTPHCFAERLRFVLFGDACEHSSLNRRDCPG
jgi:hypothetical protein